MSLTEHSTVRRLAEAVFLRDNGYPLEDWVRDARDTGLTWRQVAQQLRENTNGDVDLPIQTLINWTDGYSPEPTAAA